MAQRLAPGSAFLACALLSFTFTISASAQSAKWKRYISEHGKFSVLLPGIPKTDYMRGYACSGREMVYKAFYNTAVAGIVIKAQAVLGPDLLRESALAAARLWVFKPIECAGRPVKAYGALNFKFPPR